MTVFEYLQARPNTTSDKITKGMNRKIPAIANTLSQLCTTGRIVKSGIRDGTPIYRANDMLSGCSNGLTMVLNQLLNRTRQGTAQ